MTSKSVTFTEPDSIFKQSAAVRAAENAGFTAAFESPQVVQRPEDISGLNLSTDSCLRIDPSDLIIGEAPLLNEAEQTEALAALVEDGVFESSDWPSLYRERHFSLGKGNTFRFEPASLAVIGIKFGWALEQAARIVNASVKVGRLEIVFDLPNPATRAEHLFVGLELQRRGIRAFDLILPWGGRWEPAVDWIGEIETFESELPIHAAVAAENGGWRLGFDHAEQKFSVLPIVKTHCCDALHLNIDGLGWVEATRILARHEPDLIRALLPVAQDRFAFDKPNAEFATTEDDIRSLPDVSDSDLERVFVEDFRGRQLLRFTAPSLLQHETLGPQIRATLDLHRELHAELVDAEVRRHLAV